MTTTPLLWKKLEKKRYSQDIDLKNGYVKWSHSDKNTDGGIYLVFDVQTAVNESLEDAEKELDTYEDCTRKRIKEIYRKRFGRSG